MSDGEWSAIIALSVWWLIMIVIASGYVLVKRAKARLKRKKSETKALGRPRHSWNEMPVAIEAYVADASRRLHELRSMSFNPHNQGHRRIPARFRNQHKQRETTQ